MSSDTYTQINKLCKTMFDSIVSLKYNEYMTVKTITNNNLIYQQQGVVNLCVVIGTDWFTIPFCL